MGSLPTTANADIPAAAPPPHPDLIPNPFLARLRARQVTPVLSIKHVLGAELALMSRAARLPALFIDTEHTPLSLQSVAQLVLACNAAGVSPLVRAPSQAPAHISRILDAGAAAVVVPHVDSVHEARACVRAAKYAPVGERGCANNQPRFAYQHVPTKTQNEVLNCETMLIPMIETPAAVDVVEEILALDGVDGVLVGSNDLCCDLGIPGGYDERVYQDSVTRVVLAGKKAGKPVGIGGIGGRKDLLEMWFGMGATWSLSAADGAILQAGMRKVVGEYEDINERVQAGRANGEK